MAKTDDEEWVEVATTNQEEEASLIAGLLQSQEIPCEVEGSAGGSPWPETLGALGASRVLVPPERAAQARQLIAERKKEFRELPKESPDASDDNG